MQILDGKATSKAIREEIAQEVSRWVSEHNERPPHLAAILVGNDGASETYVNNKVKACEKCGYTSSLYRFDADVKEGTLLAAIDKLNKDPEVDGFIVQLPLPKHINEEKITLAIDPDKDIDGFHPVNIGRMTLGLDAYLPATPQGIITLLERYQIETSGKHAVVIGRSNIVGKPMSILLSRNDYPGNCTVTMCHSRTTNLEELCQQADIIVAALGRPAFVKADMIKPGAVLIDVGITRVEDASRPRGYRIVGDVDFESCTEKASYISPVPGGVGPMTVCSLLLNTLQAYEAKHLGKNTPSTHPA
jgi:methylenetetrahydrofolate dehydrogenase (NADP+)/methenyltetrahydrofolate cyclohydrolase